MSTKQSPPPPPKTNKAKAARYKRVKLATRVRNCLKCSKDFNSVSDRICPSCNSRNLKVSKLGHTASVSILSYSAKKIGN